MSPSGAYDDEMGRFLRLPDEELSRLLAGEAGTREEALGEVALLLDEVRQTYASAAPDEATRARHIAAISEASQLAADKGNPVARPVSKAHGPVDVQVSELPKWRSVMDRMIATTVKLVASTVAASMSMIGLAYAGVDLPGEAAGKALEIVTHLDLPNQGSEQDRSVADDVRAVLDGDLEGCEQGQAVANAASANRQNGATTDNDPCARGDARATANKGTGEQKSAAGRAKASEKSGGRSQSRGPNVATEGRGTAAVHSNGASEARANNAGTRGDSRRAKGGKAPPGQNSNASSNSDAGSHNAGTHHDSGTRANEASSSGQKATLSAAEKGHSRNPRGRP
jgi:hypothetical protein